MTLPTIEEPEHEQKKELITCKHCGKEGVKKSHERFCSSNPNNVRAKKKAKPADVQDPVPDKEQPAQLETPIIMSGLTSISTIMNAWYEVDNELTHIPIEVAGIMKSDGHEVSWGLVMSSNGILVPPYMLPGFVCVSAHPPNVKKEDTDNTESFPPFPVEEEEIEITESNNEPIQEPIKQPSLLSRVFGRKPHPAKQPVSCETRDLLKEVVNA